MPDPYKLGKLTRTRADGTTYWSICIIWHDAVGKRRRVSLGTTDKAAAPALAREFWASRSVGHVGTIGALVEQFLDTLPKPFPGWQGTGAVDPVRHSKIKGAQRKREGWKAATPFWGALRLSDIDDGTSGEYCRWRGKAANTMRHELGPIASALAWALGNNAIAQAPKIHLPAIPDSAVGHLTKPQFKQFLAGCASPHLHLFAVLAVTTGARKTALLQLPWVCVDFTRGLIDLRPVGVLAGELKGRPTVPVNDRLMPLLVEAKAGAMTDYVIEYQGGPVEDIKKGFAAASTRSGIPCHPHMLRHSAAVWMAEARVPMEEIAAYLGHKNVAITIRVYARYHPDYLRKAARSLDW